MTVKAQSRRKVGLLDEYQIWCHLVYPFSPFLQPQAAIKGEEKEQDGKAFHVKQMLDFFVRPANPSEKTSKMFLLSQEFVKIRKFRDQYAHNVLPEMPPKEKSFLEALEEEKKLTLEMVHKWVEKYAFQTGRLAFFENGDSTEYFTSVAEPLLSMKTTGSISVKRIAKPLKNQVVNEARNRLDESKRETPLRVGLNLLLKYRTLEHKEGLDIDIHNSYRH